MTLDVTLTIPKDGVNASDDLELWWEAWDGQGTTLLGKRRKGSNGPGPGAMSFVDGTLAFTKSCKVSFTLRAAVPRSTIHGVTSRWVRVRIVAGHYGTDMEVVVGAINAVTITKARFRPPAIASAPLSWTGTILAARRSSYATPR